MRKLGNTEERRSHDASMTKMLSRSVKLGRILNVERVACNGHASNLHLSQTGGERLHAVPAPQ